MPLFLCIKLQKVMESNFHDLDNSHFSIVQHFFVYIFHGQFQNIKYNWAVFFDIATIEGSYLNFQFFTSIL